MPTTLCLCLRRLDLNNKSLVHPGDPRANIAKLGGDFKNRPRRHQNRVRFSGVVLSPVIHRNGQGCGLFRWASYFSMVNQSAGRLLLTALLRIIQQDDKRA
jgi:hypothetical protein